jgi:hypothetical protein
LLGDANHEAGTDRSSRVAATFNKSKTTNRNKQSKIEIRKAKLEKQNAKKAASLAAFLLIQLACKRLRFIAMESWPRSRR